MAGQKTDSTPAPEKRDDDTNENVTELAGVDGDTEDKQMREMSGVGDDLDSASEQQRDVYRGMKIAAGKEDAPEPNPFRAGPGGDI